DLGGAGVEGPAADLDRPVAERARVGGYAVLDAQGPGPRGVLAAQAGERLRGEDRVIEPAQDIVVRATGAAVQRHRRPRGGAHADVEIADVGVENVHVHVHGGDLAIDGEGED